MYKSLKILVLCAICLAYISCQNTTDTATTTKKTEQQTKQQPNTTLKGLPLDMRQNLMDNCDQIDYTFFNLNFSMSQSTPDAVKGNVALLTGEVQSEIPATCKPIGRKYYQIDGDIILEAELYFSEGCLFYIYKDGHTTCTQTNYLLKA